MADIPNFIGAFAGLVGIISLAFALARSKAKDETIQIYVGLNAALKLEREEIKARVVRLESQVDLLQSEWGTHLADEVATKVVRKLNGQH